MQLPLFAVDEVIRTALQEDIHYLDTTTDLMIPADARASAVSWPRRKGWSAAWTWPCGCLRS